MLFLLLTMAALGANAADPPTQKFVVFFQEWSAAIDEPAQTVVKQAAAFAKANAGKPVRVNGFADPTGSKQANTLMSDLRAQVVADLLVSDGVDAKRIRQRGRGPVQFALSSQESRRVEISVGGR